MKPFLFSKSRQQGGFTLIELLVAISIIGVLTAVLVANMVGVRERGNDAKKKNDLRQFKTALRLFYNDFQSYPDNDEFPTYLTHGGSFTNGSGVVYMKDLPEGVSYDSVGGDTFLISVELDNAGDEDICLSATRCGQSCTEGTSTTYYECAD